MTTGRPASGDERGSVMILALAVVTAILLLAPFIVDYARAGYALTGIQRAADAASLAGASELVLSSNDYTTRWKNAKRAIIAALRENPIFMSFEFPNLAASGSGPPDACEPNGAYSRRTFDTNTMTITLARGKYDDATGVFTSHENEKANPPATDCIPDTNKSNAVQVTVTVKEFANVFARIPPFNRLTMPPMTRTAVASFVD